MNEVICGSLVSAADWAKALGGVGVGCTIPITFNQEPPEYDW